MIFQKRERQRMQFSFCVQRVCMRPFPCEIDIPHKMRSAPTLREHRGYYEKIYLCV